MDIWQATVAESCVATFRSWLPGPRELQDACLQLEVWPFIRTRSLPEFREEEGGDADDVEDDEGNGEVLIHTEVVCTERAVGRLCLIW